MLSLIGLIYLYTVLFQINCVVLQKELIIGNSVPVPVLSYIQHYIVSIKTGLWYSYCWFICTPYCCKVTTFHQPSQFISKMEKQFNQIYFSLNLKVTNIIKLVQMIFNSWSKCFECVGFTSHRFNHLHCLIYNLHKSFFVCLNMFFYPS